MESLGGLLFPVLILLLFIPIFLSGRKQRRQVQTMQQLQSSLQVGDVVTTTSGLRGTIVDASYEETVDLEIAEDVVTTWLRVAVRDKVVDGTADTAGDTTDDLAPEVSGVTTAPVTDHDAPTGSSARADSVVEPVADRPSDANGTTRP